MAIQLSRRHLPFLLAAGCGAAAFIAFYLLQLKGAVAYAACLFFVIYLALTAIRIPRMTASYLKTNAARADEPAPIIFLVTLIAVIASVASLFLLLNSPERPSGIALALSLGTVALGWLTIHTMAALHYAHLYWRPEGEAKTKGKWHGGLEFPGGTVPGAYDFLYFAFVTGMTAQTSDVEITMTSLRKFNLLHSLVSFLFNTVLVAAAVNVAVSLAD